jgi:hypothetical protein
MPELNTELLVRVYQHIQHNPDKHDQNQWAAKFNCNTTYCFAGWTAVLSDQVVAWKQSSDWSGFRATLLTSGKTIPQYAAERLGLNRAQEDLLFYAYDLEEIRKVINDWTGVDPHLPE